MCLCTYQIIMSIVCICCQEKKRRGSNINKMSLSRIPFLPSLCASEYRISLLLSLRMNCWRCNKKSVLIFSRRAKNSCCCSEVKSPRTRPEQQASGQSSTLSRVQFSSAISDTTQLSLSRYAVTAGRTLKSCCCHP